MHVVHIRPADSCWAHQLLLLIVNLLWFSLATMTCSWGITAQASALRDLVQVALGQELEEEINPVGDWSGRPGA